MATGAGGVLPRRALGFEGLQALTGSQLPPTPWFSVDQQCVDAFAAITGDMQWIHVDPARAAAGPFGTTIAHGFLTLSLLPRLWREAVEVEGFTSAVNYGLDYVRFTAPVLTPSRVRGRLRVEDVREVHGSVQVRLHAIIEREDGERPVCIAVAIFRYYR